jgi:pimeloyl-ACP methyl ester carboxylesterase
VTTRSIDPVWWEFAVRGVTLRGTVQGRAEYRPPDAAAVVAVHGGPGVDGGGLRLVLAPLAGHAELVVPDLRGHGPSDLAEPASWTLDDWADDLAGVIDALALHRPVVVGVSFGGWVALRYASRYPDQLGSLVVAAATARLPTVEEGAERMRTLGGPASAAAWRAVHADPRFEATAAFAEHVMTLMARRQPSRELAAVRAAQIKTPQVNEHFTPLFSQLDLTGDARRTRCPVTVVVGERDPLTTPKLAADTADACPGPARLRIIPDTAHDLLTDAPDILLAEINSALTTRETSDRPASDEPITGNSGRGPAAPGRCHRCLS